MCWARGFRGELPQTAALFKQVESDSKFFTNAAKEHWDRPRPYTSVKEIHPSGKLENSAAIPPDIRREERFTRNPGEPISPTNGLR